MTSADVIPVLVYHGVRERSVHGLDRFTVTPRTLGAHARLILDCGRATLTMSELAEVLTGARRLEAPAAAITFDDGYDDTPGAVETLLAHGIASTTYVTTGPLGTRARLDDAGVRHLGGLGPRVELGAHGVTHTRLDELAPGAARREVVDSVQDLEERLGRAVRTFAYPHGAHDRDVRRAVIDAGLSSAAAVKNALSHPRDDPFAVARFLVEAETPPRRIADILAGGTLPVAQRRERARTTVYRRVRRARRRLRGAAR